MNSLDRAIEEFTISLGTALIEFLTPLVLFLTTMLVHEPGSFDKKKKQEFVSEREIEIAQRILSIEAQTPTKAEDLIKAAELLGVMGRFGYSYDDFEAIIFEHSSDNLADFIQANLMDIRHER